MKTKKEKSNTWFSNDNRVLWRLPKDLLWGRLKPVTVRYVEKNTKRALKFVSEIAGEKSAILPKLSSVALKDFDVVSTLLEINHSTSIGTKRLTSNAFEYLSKEEQELGIDYAKAVLEAVGDDFRGESNGETLPILRYAVEKFQLWLEWLTDAAVRIRLGIKRGVA